MTLTTPTHDEPWMEYAMCLGLDCDLFFPARGATFDNWEAQAVCATCSVRDECLDYALAENIRHGVWGGKSEHERRRMRRLQLRVCIECQGMFEMKPDAPRSTLSSDECQRSRAAASRRRTA